MSHVSQFGFAIPKKRLSALKMAVEKFCPELEFVRGQKEYRTWKTDRGSLVGDWDLPKGVTSNDVGKNAHHVIRMKDSALAKRGVQRNQSGAPYEIGLVPMKVTRDKNGKVIDKKYDPNGNEYDLVCDFWQQGNGLLNCEGVGRATQKSGGRDSNSVQAMDQLKMFYQMMLDKVVAEEVGDTIEFTKLKDGSYQSRTVTQARVGT